MQPFFHDRRDAGKSLSHEVRAAVGGADVLVLGLAKGGVPVAYEVARALGAPLDVFVLRKLEVPKHDGASMGAIAAGGVRVLDARTIQKFAVSAASVEEVVRQEAVALARVERYYRDRRPGPRMTARTIVLVDDGLSSPWILSAAVDALRAYQPARIIVATPALASEGGPMLAKRASVIALDQLENDTPVYEDDDGVSDRDIRHLLAEAEARDRRHPMAS